MIRRPLRMEYAGLRRLGMRVREHPVVIVFGVALVARLLFALAENVVSDRNTIPDEGLYLELGRNVVHGIDPEVWYPGYGQSFYDSTRVFSAPLLLLFRIFGPERIVGQVFVAIFGAGVAAVTVLIARHLLKPPF